jgi:hypothetical protein
VNNTLGLVFLFVADELLDRNAATMWACTASISLARCVARVINATAAAEQSAIRALEVAALELGCVPRARRPSSPSENFLAAKQRAASIAVFGRCSESRARRDSANPDTLPQNLEKIGHGTFKVITQLGDIIKVHALRAVVVQL